MATPAPLQVRDALDELVNQFADPMSFLRELVQNAVDAGSEEVEVRVEYEGNNERDGAIVCCIDDWGEGMTREIIDKRLTRLFSSGKDGDMTKIGKFGIGFVSVFAIEPDAVCVDTSREGETWRVLFSADRTFKLIRREEPVDGTKIRIYKRGSKEDAEAFGKRAREVLRYWCKHVGAELRFGDDPVGEPFAVDAVVSVEHDDGFSHVVVGHARDSQSFAGYYNSGLTLIEHDQSVRPGLQHKASSPHLEHTLTRDNIIRDAGYERVSEQLATLVDGPLADAAFERLESASSRDLPVGKAGEAAKEDLAALLLAVTRHLAWGHGAGERRRRALARAPSGARIELAALSGKHRDAEILVTDRRSPLTDALEARGSTVVQMVPGTPLMNLLRAAAPEGTRCRPLQGRYCMPVVDDASPTRGPATRLAAALRALLEQQDAKLASVSFGDFVYEGSPIAERIAITQAKPGEITVLEEAVDLGRAGLFSRGRALVVNARHPGVPPLVSLARHEPELAAYLLTKQFFLVSGLDVQRDASLVTTSLETRWRRSTT